MGCKHSTAFPPGLRRKRAKNNSAKTTPEKEATKVDPVPPGPTQGDASDGPAVLITGTKRSGKWSSVGIGGQSTTQCGDMCPVELPTEILERPMSPQKHWIAPSPREGEVFGFVDGKFTLSRYRIQESVSSLDLSGGGSSSLVTNSNLRPISNGLNRLLPDHGKKQQSVSPRRMLTIQAEKTEAKNLDMWIERQNEIEKEKTTKQD